MKPLDNEQRKISKFLKKKARKQKGKKAHFAASIGMSKQRLNYQEKHGLVAAKQRSELEAAVKRALTMLSKGIRPRGKKGEPTAEEVAHRLRKSHPMSRQKAQRLITKVKKKGYEVERRFSRGAPNEEISREELQALYCQSRYWQ